MFKRSYKLAAFTLPRNGFWKSAGLVGGGGGGGSGLRVVRWGGGGGLLSPEEGEEGLTWWL